MSQNLQVQNAGIKFFVLYFLCFKLFEKHFDRPVTFLLHFRIFLDHFEHHFVKEIISLV